MYCTYSDYVALYGGELTEADFARFAFAAGREIDKHTTGADGVRKLSEYPPTGVYEQTAIANCECRIIHEMNEMERAAKALGVIVRADGTVSSAIVNSVSSGSESMSFAGVSGGLSDIAKSPTERSLFFRGIVQDCLSGLTDANGVNLLYMGVYPYVR